MRREPIIEGFNIFGLLDEFQRSRTDDIFCIRELIRIPRWVVMDVTNDYDIDVLWIHAPRNHTIFDIFCDINLPHSSRNPPLYCGRVILPVFAHTEVVYDLGARRMDEEKGEGRGLVRDVRVGGDDELAFRKPQIASI